MPNLHASVMAARAMPREEDSSGTGNSERSLPACVVESFTRISSDELAATSCWLMQLYISPDLHEYQKILIAG